MKAQYAMLSLLFFLLSTGMIYGESDPAAGTRIDAAGTRLSSDVASQSNSAKQNSAEEREIVESDEIFACEKKCSTKRKRYYTNSARREVNPFQLHFLLAGVSSAPVDSTIGAGLHLGYQVSKTYYVGLSSHTAKDANDSSHNHNGQYEERSYLGQKGVSRIETNGVGHHFLEMRVFPFDFGLYFSGGIMYVDSKKTTLTFRKSNRVVGDNEYANTGLEATLEYDEWYGAGTGVGFNHIFANGFSLSTGLNVGLGFQNGDVTVGSTGSVTAADLEIWKEQIESNERRRADQIYFSLGHSF